jgi:hypothetical protein
MEFGQLKKKMHLAECAEMKEAIQLVQVYIKFSSRGSA